MATTLLNTHVEDLQLSEDLTHLPMIAMYDEAFKKLISQVFAGQVILAPQERAFDLYINQTKDDKIKFPFISLFPLGNYTRIHKNFAASHIGERINRQAIIYDNDTIEKKGNNKLMQNFYQLLYFDIPYQLVCWSNNRIQALQLVQELMFWLDTQGQVLVQYKDNKYTANLTIDNKILDNTGYTDYANLGNIYRFIITINIQAPVLRTQNYLNINKVPFELKLQDDIKNPTKEQVITEELPTDARKDDN